MSDAPAWPAAPVVSPLSPWRPQGALGETIPFAGAGANTAGPASGTLLLAGGITLPAGQQTSGCRWISGTTPAGAPTRQWACLVRASDLAVLAKSADAGAAAWAATTLKSFAWTTPYAPVTDEPVYVGLVVVATTPPSLRGQSGSLATAQQRGAPFPAASSTAALTDPASLGAVAGALTALGEQPWAALT